MADTFQQNLQILSRMFPNVDADVRETVLHVQQGNLNNAINILLEMAGPDDSDGPGSSSPPTNQPTVPADTATSSPPIAAAANARASPAETWSPQLVTQATEESAKNAASPTAPDTALNDAAELSSPRASQDALSSATHDAPTNAADTSRDEQIARDLELALQLEDQERQQYEAHQHQTSGQPPLPQRPLYSPQGRYNVDFANDPTGPHHGRKSPEFIDKVTAFTESSWVKLQGLWNQVSHKINEAVKDHHDPSHPMPGNASYGGGTNSGGAFHSRIIQDEEDEAYNGPPPPLPRRSTDGAQYQRHGSAGAPPVLPGRTTSAEHTESSGATGAARASVVMVKPGKIVSPSPTQAIPNPLPSATDQWVSEEQLSADNQSAQPLRTMPKEETSPMATTASPSTAAPATTSPEPHRTSFSDIDMGNSRSPSSAPLAQTADQASPNAQSPTTPAQPTESDTDWNMVDKDASVSPPKVE
ncbi:hypothetical protein H4R35_001056 [Dimargaris xerosporica]|nr:hypothetical protein H4R35_001056 [Dimargaris xerosporica]